MTKRISERETGKYEWQGTDLSWTEIVFLCKVIAYSSM